MFEGYLGIKPRLDFFTYYFNVKRQTVKGKLVSCGTVSFNMRWDYGKWYLRSPLWSLSKGGPPLSFIVRMCRLRVNLSECRMPPFVDVADVPNDAWNEKPVKVIPSDLSLIKRRITKLTFGLPKLTGKDIVLCWITRRIQPLQHRDQLLCEYTGEASDPQRTCKEDFDEHHLAHRMNQLVKNRPQYTESLPM